MKRGAIFDMDGTLFDTEKCYFQAWLDAAEEFGEARNPAVPTAAAGTNMGEQTIRIVKKFYPNIDAEKYIARVLEFAREVPKKDLVLMAGVEDILKFFEAAGVSMAVASSAPVAVIENNLERVNLRGYFKALVGGDKVQHGKPAPDIFLLAAKELNLAASDCYIFEDSFNGIRAANASGGAAIMIPDQFPPTEEIKKLCAAIYPSLIEARRAVEHGEI